MRPEFTKTGTDSQLWDGFRAWCTRSMSNYVR